MDRIISESHAKLGDPAQMQAFLAKIPNGENLNVLLQRQPVVTTRTYDDEAMIARFVRSDGDTVACYSVQDITIDEAEMVAAQCELLEQWNFQSFARAVHTALDP